MLLTEYEIATIGQELAAANNVSDIDFARAVIAAYEAKLREQNEPVGIARRMYSPGYRIEELPDYILKDGMELFTHPAPIPEGYALVPIEPTTHMVNEGLCGCMDNDVTVCIWKKMLAAARGGE